MFSINNIKLSFSQANELVWTGKYLLNNRYVLEPWFSFKDTIFNPLKEPVNKLTFYVKINNSLFLSSEKVNVKYGENCIILWFENDIELTKVNFFKNIYLQFCNFIVFKLLND